MANDKIVIKGAREHNLKNVNLTLPREKFIVMTGLSGSGKSSLAFDTIYADGQRRYVESLSSYARMFLGRMDKPDVDEITGLSPAVSIDQKTTSHNPRSTVGTVTEIYDYLRLLYARVGTPHSYGSPFWGLNVRGAARRAISKAAVTKAIAVSTTTVNNVKSVILKVIFNLTTKDYFAVKGISFVFFSEGKRTIRYGTLK